MTVCCSSNRFCGSVDGDSHHTCVKCHGRSWKINITCEMYCMWDEQWHKFQKLRESQRLVIQGRGSISWLRLQKVPLSFLDFLILIQLHHLQLLSTSSCSLATSLPVVPSEGQLVNMSWN